MLADPSYRMVVMDEINVALRYEYLKLETVLAALAARPPLQHAVLTGRNAAAFSLTHDHRVWRRRLSEGVCGF